MSVVRQALLSYNCCQSGACKKEFLPIVLGLVMTIEESATGLLISGQAPEGSDPLTKEQQLDDLRQHAGKFIREYWALLPPPPYKEGYLDLSHTDL
jgi:hypothetical protein